MQINQITQDMIASGLCDNQNFPYLKDRPNKIQEIGIKGNSSICLKNIVYSDMYFELRKCKYYNIKMIDGALITFLYRFQNNEIKEHRLSFFPSPVLEIFENQTEPYLEDEIYLDILDKQSVIVPLRFDYDSSDAFTPMEHPKSHLTLGQYKNCRIPVSSAVTPYQFMSFIIRNFYYTAQNKGYIKLKTCTDKFEKSIVREEENLVHVCTPL